MRIPLRSMRRAPLFALALATLAALPLRAITPSVADSLSIRDLLDISTAQILDLSADGRWLVVSISSRRDGLGTDFSRDGDPTYLRAPAERVVIIDTRTGTQHNLWNTKKTVRNATWAPDGGRLAMLVVENDALQVTVWNRTTGAFTVAKIPPGRYVAENSELRWTDDGRQLVFAAHTDAWRAKAKARFAELTQGPITVLNSKDDFLEWDEMTRMPAQRSIVAWDVASGAVRTLAPEGLLGPWTLAKDGSAITTQEDLTRKTDYEASGGGREYKVVTQSLAPGGGSRVLFPSTKGIQIQWADDGIRYMYGQDGKVFLASIADTARRQILGPVGPTPAAGGDSTGTAAGRGGRGGRGGGGGGGANGVDRFTPVRWSPSGDAIAASNRQGIWVVDVRTGAREMVMEAPDTNAAPAAGGGGGRGGRGQLGAWSQDGRWMYFNNASHTQWERSITRYDRQTKQKTDLVKDAKYYTALRLSKDGSTAALAVAEGNHVADIYVADPALGNMKRVVETNPQLAAKPIAKTELIQYLDADGQSRYGVLRYPTNYQKGTRYPTVFIIYEDFFDDSWDAMANLLAAHGYAVVNPSVGFEIGYPSEAWLKGVTAAANAVIAMGVADSARLGVHGTSYGGYATNLLITQTHRFKAAINMSGKVDIISFYTDSPRLGARNINAAEKTQDRIGATLWEQPQKYVQHSAVMFADRITTPLLMLTGGQDHNVPQINTREMYYALRRLGKTVTWVSYANSGHGVPQTTETDFLDYHQRVLDWYAKYLAPPRPGAKPSASNRGNH
jgi:dipeptidyl aminopeptidase/acylaminoacyl peptidase